MLRAVFGEEWSPLRFFELHCVARNGVFRLLVPVLAVACEMLCSHMKDMVHTFHLRVSEVCLVVYRLYTSLAKTQLRGTSFARLAYSRYTTKHSSETRK